MQMQTQQQLSQHRSWETSAGAAALQAVEDTASLVERAPIEEYTHIITAHQEQAIETFLVMGIMGYTHAFMDNDPYVTRLFSLTPHQNVRMQVIPASVPLLARWIHLSDLVEYVDNMNESHEQEQEGYGGDENQYLHEDDEEDEDDEDDITEVVEVIDRGGDDVRAADVGVGGWEQVDEQYRQPVQVPQEWLNPALSSSASQGANANANTVFDMYED